MRRKYYKTHLILTFRLSEGSLGKPFCENPLGFDDKTAIATLARSGGVRKRAQRPKRPLCSGVLREAQVDSVVAQGGSGRLRVAQCCSGWLWGGSVGLGRWLGKVQGGSGWLREGPVTLGGGHCLLRGAQGGSGGFRGGSGWLRGAQGGLRKLRVAQGGSG